MVERSGKRACVNCGKETHNPRYCSRSCAAQENNRTSPKRGPEGRCVDCGTAIPSKAARCAVCKTKAESQARAAKQREENNIRSFRTLNGQLIDLPLPRMHVSEAFVYTPSSFTIGKITPDQPCEVLLDKLIGVVFAKPGYLQADDVCRYASLIHEFKKFAVDRGWGTTRKSVYVTDLPIRDIGSALRHWVESTLRNHSLSLMPTFVLDAGRFIETHVWGRHFYGRGNEAWEITPLVEGMEEPRSSGGLDDAQLKKEITTAFARLLVRLQIPEGFRIKNVRSETIADSGGTAYLSIERCHLSSGIYDDIDLEIEGDNSPKHDVSEEFQLRGKLWSREAVEALLQGSHEFPYDEHRLLKVEVPGRWITAELTRECTWREVPRWDP
jgi:hypothetical protein